MAVTKKELKSNKTRVSFKIPSEISKDFKSAALVGNFNNWDATKDVMKKLKKDGSFSIQKSFEKGKEYEFKYLLDGENWVTEVEADKLVPTPFPDSQNSVLVV